VDAPTELSDAAEYRSLSPVAALAFLLGLLSVGSLATSALLVVPVAAVGVGCLALSRIRTSDGALTGARLAQWGIALAVCLAVTTLVRDPVRNALMRRQTGAVADKWLSLVAEGRLSDSLKLLDTSAIQGLSHIDPHDGTKAPSPDEVRAKAIEHLGEDELAKRLASIKPPLRMSEGESDAAQPLFDGARTLIGGQRIVESSAEGPALRVNFSFVRLPFYESEGRPWRIERWKVVDDSQGARSGGN
jgi:hypothetical protein